MQYIKNLIFDLGGVILTLDMAKTGQKLDQLGISSYDELFRNGDVTDFFKAYETGKISTSDFLDRLRGLSGKQLSNEVLIDAWNAMLGIFPVERVELLNKLSSKYRVFLFSNTNALHVDAFRTTYSNSFNNQIFDSLFEKAYYSHLLQLRKPDVVAFEAVINDKNLLPQETLFMDDSLANIEGAEKAGINAIHIHKNNSILDIDFGL